MNVIAVDVGTTSVRLSIVEFGGKRANEVKVLTSHKKETKHRQDGDRFEQSSRELWQAVCECSRECLSRCEKSTISSIAFSATCSLLTLTDPEDDAVENKNDIIMWLDHRAIDTAQSITKSNAKVLEQFGGVCSPEFSLSKLIWLSQNNSNFFKNARGFFELPDWLVYKCIGGDPSQCPRSLCCVTCKWGFDQESGHCDLLTKLFGERTSSCCGKSILTPGSIAGHLSMSAAVELGLADNQDKENNKPLQISVATSLIDAHSGMLAMLSAPLEQFHINHKIESTLCSLAGTSTCHMVLSKGRQFTHGVWGPYKDVVLHGYHLLEAGQTLTGRLIEICIESHLEGRRRIEKGEKVYSIIESLNKQAQAFGSKSRGALHVLPTFHGNRSPLANPRLMGGLYGLTADGSASLLDHYIATVESLAYETKLIVATLNTQLDTVLVSGGLMKNYLYMQVLADVLQCKVVKMGLENVDFMVMGSALLARQAALASLAQETNNKIFMPLTRESIENIQYKQIDIEVFEPRIDTIIHHEKRYLCYKEFVMLSDRIDKIMNMS